MPGIYDFLMNPMVPQEAIQPLQDAIDSPTGDYGPLEARVRGFGAGALEGLRSLTSPANLASMAFLRTARPTRIPGPINAPGGRLGDMAAQMRAAPHSGPPPISAGPKYDAAGKLIKNVPDNPVAQDLERERQAIEALFALAPR